MCTVYNGVTPYKPKPKHKPKPNPIYYYTTVSICIYIYIYICICTLDRMRTVCATHTRTCIYCSTRD